MLVEKRFLPLYISLFIVFALFGISMTVIGATLPKIFAEFGWSYMTAGIVIAAGSIGYFLSSYLAGILFPLLGIRLTISLSLILICCGLELFARTPIAWLNMMLYFIIGVGQGGIEIAVDWAVLRMEGPGGGKAMSLMHGAFSIGAVVGPLIIAILISANLEWTLVYRIIGILFLGIAIFMQFMPLRFLGKDRAHITNRSRRDLFQQPMYWLGFFALFVYVGVELGISNWIAEYFVSVFRAPIPTGSFMVSLFWAGLLMGRFGIPIIQKSIKRERILIALSTLMAISLIAFNIIGFIGDGRIASVAAGIMVILAGFGCSIIYPTIMSIIGDSFPHAQSEAVGFAAMGGGIGGFLFPYMMSAVSTGWGIRTGFAIYAFFSLLIVILNILLVRAQEQKSNNISEL
ncbi:MAG: Glucose/mannose transporter GlcP [Spirochaetes bacterium ADurb.Bin110]|nr:MAG: Glucose/mannose transporter GlcP [Spirochaetes bacterium ADurb.Bin110]